MRDYRTSCIQFQVCVCVCLRAGLHTHKVHSRTDRGVHFDAQSFSQGCAEAVFIHALEHNHSETVTK